MDYFSSGLLAVVGAGVITYLAVNLLVPFLGLLAEAV
jgi:hypothetical protein